MNNITIDDRPTIPKTIKRCQHCTVTSLYVDKIEEGRTAKRSCTLQKKNAQHEHQIGVPTNRTDRQQCTPSKNSNAWQKRLATPMYQNAKMNEQAAKVKIATTCTNMYQFVPPPCTNSNSTMSQQKSTTCRQKCHVNRTDYQNVQQVTQKCFFQKRKKNEFVGR